MLPLHQCGSICVRIQHSQFRYTSPVAASCPLQRALNLAAGLEPATPVLPRQCSALELRQSVSTCRSSLCVPRGSSALVADTVGLVLTVRASSSARSWALRELCLDETRRNAQHALVSSRFAMCEPCTNKPETSLAGRPVYVVERFMAWISWCSSEPRARSSLQPKQTLRLPKCCKNYGLSREPSSKNPEFFYQRRA